MEDYHHITGNTPIKRYAIDSEHITVQFKNNEVYQYSYASAGKHHIETMKLLAKAGWGLESYIEHVVKQGYSRQLV